jgi:hypothetical protein
MHSLLKNPLVIMAVIGIVLFCICVKREKETMHNTKNTCGVPYVEYNPRTIQPDIAEMAQNNNFIPLPEKGSYPWSDNIKEYGETEILDDGAMGRMGLNFNLCSKSCCSPQWPVGFDMPEDEFIKKSGKQFVPSPYTCNNGWQDTGCLCLEKDQAQFLDNRGNNAGK